MEAKSFKVLFLFLFYIFIASLTSCGTTKVIVDYSQTSVPEEGGVKFVKFTSDEERVLGTVVTVDEAGKMLWNAAPYIAISFDGEKLAYSARKETSTDNIFIKNIKGGKATVQRTFRNNAFYPAFSPNGEHIAFCDNPENNTNVYMMKTEGGSAVQQITTDNAVEIGPSFSNDGKMVFYSKSENVALSDGTTKSQYNIWSYNLETSLLTQYSKGFTPNMIPNSTELVITRVNNQNGLGEIWKIDIEKGQETLLLNDAQKGYSSPAISPDGKYIVCVGTTLKTETRPMNLDIYVFKIDGSALTQLTFHGGHDFSPQWAPDGKSIFFISQRGSTEKGRYYNVWQMDYRN